jgi:hypothetical protein
MHGRSAARTPAEDAGAASAAAPAAVPGPDSALILFLQRAIGNAAVVRLIASGRAEADQDGAAMLHQVLREPGTPLGWGVRSEMERHFEADFSDVRVHTGSAARESAASVGARAYTSGNHVVVGRDGADRPTLAHELAHVVQQRSGPVMGTDIGDGLRVSHPGDRFERQASAAAASFATRDHRLGEKPGQSGTAAPDGPASQGTVLQRAEVVSQISEEDGKITDLVVTGRPVSPHQGTMGEHLAPFAMIVETVRSRVVGCEPEEAVSNIGGLYVGTKELLGYDALAIGRLPRRHSELLAEAQDGLEELFISYSPRESLGTRILAIQDMCSMYLQFREALPLSVVNVKDLQKSPRGKGRSEAHTLRALHELLDRNRLSATAVKDLVWQLFDSDAAAFAVVPPAPFGSESALPGIDPKVGQAAVAQALVEQYVDTVELAFPKLVETFWKSRDEVVADFTGRLDKVVGVREAEQRKEAEYAQETKRSRDFFSANRDAVGAKGGKRSRGSAVVPSTTRQSRRKQTDRLNLGRGESSRPKGEQTPKRNTSKPTDRVELTPKRQQAWKRGVSEAQSLAVQLMLHDGRVREVRSSGRPPSIFGNTMGAHTTAWVVYLDVVRRLVVGRDLPEACKALSRQIESEAAAPSMLKSAGTGKYETRRMDRQAKAKKALDGLHKPPHTDDEDDVSLFFERFDDPLFLQEFIVAYLTWLNYAPGAVLDAGDTNAKREGRLRKKIRDYEANKIPLLKPELTRLLLGLFDIPEGQLPKEEARERQMERHLDVVRVAYPKAYAASRLPRMSRSEALALWETMREAGT